MKRILAAFVNSYHGLVHGFKNEAPIREEIILLIVSIPFAFFLAQDAWHFLLLISVLLLILIIELLNTGIEALADKITMEHSSHIKIAKDCGSAAVLGATLIALGVWGVSLYEYLFLN
jgi:diacylglycerol kinase (ATP)